MGKRFNDAAHIWFFEVSMKNTRKGINITVTVKA
jgi:hypothetical protein